MGVALVFLPGVADTAMRFLFHVRCVLFLRNRLLTSGFAISEGVAGVALQFCFVSQTSVGVASLQPTDMDVVSMGGSGVQSFRVTSTRGLSSGAGLFGCMSISVKACGADTNRSM